MAGDFSLPLICFLTRVKRRTVCKAYLQAKREKLQDFAIKCAIMTVEFTVLSNEIYANAAWDVAMNFQDCLGTPYVIRKEFMFFSVLEVWF